MFRKGKTVRFFFSKLLFRITPIVEKSRPYRHFKKFNFFFYSKTHRLVLFFNCIISDLIQKPISSETVVDTRQRRQTQNL